MRGEFSSIPLSAVELGIDMKKYYELARNIKRIDSLSLSQREDILNRANQTLSVRVRFKVLKLVTDMAYDKKVYEIAELPYHEGPPKNQGLFTTAVIDYLLRKEGFSENRD